MKKINFCLLIPFFFSLLQAAEISSDTYHSELIKFYLKAEKFQLANSYADSALQKEAEIDSLYYWKAIALEKSGRTKKAVENYGQALILAENQDFLKIVSGKLHELLLQIPAMQAIELHTNLIEKVKDKKKYKIILLILAELYEQNQLFGEANDVYKTILNEKIDADTTFFQLKIAKNQIFQKRYELAMRTLENSIINGDTLQMGDILYYYFLASSSAEKQDIARKTLIELYRDFPQHSKKKEILQALAESFSEENPLLSWFFWDELFTLADDAEKIKILDEIEELKKKIAKKDFMIGQFRKLKFSFPETSITEMLRKRKNIDE